MGHLQRKTGTVDVSGWKEVKAVWKKGEGEEEENGGRRNVDCEKKKTKERVMKFVTKSWMGDNNVYGRRSHKVMVKGMHVEV